MFFVSPKSQYNIPMDEVRRAYMGDINLQEIGKRISRRRRLLGLTQEQLAEEMEVSFR